MYPSIYGNESPMSTRIISLCRVLTSLVPPVHNQGVSSAPLQGLALWCVFLPTTGSFFVSCITDFFPATAPSGERFPVTFLLFIASSYHGWSQSSIFSFQRLRPHDTLFLSLYAAGCISGLTMSFNIFCPS